MIILDELSEVFLISIGSIIGACSRYILTNQFFFLFKNRDIGLNFVNLSSTFLLGLVSTLFLGLDSSDRFYSIGLIICVGFLGSFSTFSSFIVNLLHKIINREWKDFFMNIFLSLFFSLFLAYLGFTIANG